MVAVLEAYDRLCRRRGVLDFDGLLEAATQLLEHDEEVRGAFRWRTRLPVRRRAAGHEPRAVRPLGGLAGDDPDLFAVGDPNQSIYGWNGADPNLLETLAERWPPTRVVTLPRNHRSTEAIVRVATAALDRGPLDLVAATEGGTVPRIVAFDDDEQEATGVAAWCRTVHGPARTWRQTAVLSRTNAALDALAAACGRAGVPVLRLGAEQAPASDLEGDGPRRWDAPEGPDAVVLSTIHRAKGLEWTTSRSRASKRARCRSRARRPSSSSTRSAGSSTSR